MYVCIYCPDDKSLSVLGQNSRRLELLGAMEVKEEVRMTWGKNVYRGSIVKIGDEEKLTEYANAANSKILKRIGTDDTHTEIVDKLSSFNVDSAISTKRKTVTTEKLALSKLQEEELSPQKRKRSLGKKGCTHASTCTDSEQHSHCEPVAKPKGKQGKCKKDESSTQGKIQQSGAKQRKVEECVKSAEENALLKQFSKQTGQNQKNSSEERGGIIKQTSTEASENAATNKQKTSEQTSAEATANANQTCQRKSKQRLLFSDTPVADTRLTKTWELCTGNIKPPTPPADIIRFYRALANPDVQSYITEFLQYYAAATDYEESHDGVWTDGMSFVEMLPPLQNNTSESLDQNISLEPHSLSSQHLSEPYSQNQHPVYSHTSHLRSYQQDLSGSVNSDTQLSPPPHQPVISCTDVQTSQHQKTAQSPSLSDSQTLGSSSITGQTPQLTVAQVHATQQVTQQGSFFTPGQALQQARSQHLSLTPDQPFDRSSSMQSSTQGKIQQHSGPMSHQSLPLTPTQVPQQSSLASSEIPYQSTPLQQSTSQHLLLTPDQPLNRYSSMQSSTQGKIQQHSAPTSHRSLPLTSTPVQQQSSLASTEIPYQPTPQLLLQTPQHSAAAPVQGPQLLPSTSGQMAQQHVATSQSQAFRRSPRKLSQELTEETPDLNGMVRLLKKSNIMVNHRQLRKATRAANDSSNDRAGYKLASKVVPLLFTDQELAVSCGQGIRAKKGDCRPSLEPQRLNVLRDYVTAWCCLHKKGIPKEREINDAVTEQISYARKKMRRN